MLVWRVTRKAHAEQPLSREGARRYGGRWNHIGVAVVYTSQSLSLAVLEYLVNLPITDLPSDLVSIQIEIPDDLPRTEITIKELPDDWRTFPAVEELKDIGTDWARQAAAPILVVPSVVIPSELNYLVNPTHALSNGIKIVSVDAFALDTRLYSTRKPARKGSRKVSR
ncbi:MAG: RES family NAD+ phosphorylase [Halobacteriota archaeon]